MKVELVEAKEFHCGQMVRKLRSEHKAAIAHLGINTHRELRRAFDDSGYRKALLVDGRLAGLGGVTGPMAAASGKIWLAITEEATHHPHLITRVCLRELHAVLRIKRELDTFVLPYDQTSIRFAKMFGFRTLRNGMIDIGEGKAVPMVIRAEPIYTRLH